MKNKFKLAVEQYQCPGCVAGCDTTCFSEHETGIGCGKHCAGTIIFPGIGNVFLGMPKGFNRLGEFTHMIPLVFNTFESSECPYDKYNIPSWKFLSKDGHTFVRGLMPRRNEPFMHIYLENCIDKIDCLELTQDDIDYMD